MSDHISTFEQHRDHLRAVAYRMVGSASEAKDLVQDTYLRWKDVDSSEVNDSKSYLTTIVTRLSIDHMKSARAKREEYQGPWLPEPVAGDAYRDPDRAAELADSLSVAFLLLLESLNPIERAVFLLREVFGYEYDEIGEVVDKTVVNCRKIASRARRRVSKRSSRFDPDEEKREQLLSRFMKAVEGDDMDGLLDLLAEDIVLYSDGGGEVPAALAPIQGSGRVSRFLLGIKNKVSDTIEIVPALVNGRQGFVAYVDGQAQSAWSFRIENGRIQNIYVVVNPNKLAHLNRG